MWESLISKKKVEKAAAESVPMAKKRVKSESPPQPAPKKTMTVADFFKRQTDVAPSSRPITVKSEPIIVKTESVPRKMTSQPATVKTESAFPTVKHQPPNVNKATVEVKKEQMAQSLRGKTIVFTGNMSIDRERAIDLAVAAGGKVTSAVSGKTTYLVTGAVLEDGRAIEEGSKYKKLKQLESEGKPGPSLLTEDQFLALVGVDPVPLSPAPVGEIAAVITAKESTIPPLWVDKYEPQSLQEYVGNASTVKKLIEWLQKWQSHAKPTGGFKPSGFPGRGGNTDAKAVLLSGPPGIGKSLIARLACKATGFALIEYNASDYRSKSAVELIGSSVTTAAFSFTSGANHKLNQSHQCLVMDEVDGMSSGDRGGNQALIQVIKKSSIPIICICNDRMSPKVRSLANHCYDLKMQRPTRADVVRRAKQILAAEKISEVSDAIVEQIVDGSDCDIRQVINQLEGDSFDWTATMRAFEKKDKSTMLNGFEACRAILAPPPGLSVNDRLDLFFVDYDLIPLLVQQNYVKCFQPGEMRLMPRSAALISFGDVISRSVRSEQNWSLLPAFGLIGSIFVPPKMDAGYSPYPDFPAWLGKNSTARKSARIAQELECVVSSASSVTARNILRSNYAHCMYVHFVNELMEAGRSGEPRFPTLDRFGVSKNDLLELLTELLLPWQPDIYAEKTDAKMKAAITRLATAHHATLKIGGAHFRTLKAGGGTSLSLAISDERGERESAVDEDETGETKSSKKDVDSLVKAAKPKAAPKKKTDPKRKA